MASSFYGSILKWWHHSYSFRLFWCFCCRVSWSSPNTGVNFLRKLSRWPCPAHLDSLSQTTATQFPRILPLTRAGCCRGLGHVGLVTYHQQRVYVPGLPGMAINPLGFKRETKEADQIHILHRANPQANWHHGWNQRQYPVQSLDHILCWKVIRDTKKVTVIGSHSPSPRSSHRAFWVVGVLKLNKTGKLSSFLVFFFFF